MYNTTDLVNAIIRNQGMPQNSPNKFSDDDLIAFLNEELRWLITTEFLALNEDFFIENITIPLVANTSSYVIPEKAVGWALNEIYWVGKDNIQRRLARRSRRNEERGGTAAPAPTAVFITDYKIDTFPEINANPDGSLLLTYVRIQNLLRKTAACAQITGVLTVGTDYTLSVATLPQGYTNGVDIIGGVSPYEIISLNATAVAGALSITVPMAGFDRPPVIGDWICETGYTVFPHIPSEWHPLLAQAATVKSLEAGGDKANSQVAASRLSTMIEEMKKTCRNRIKNAPKKIVPRNYILNAQRFRRFGWY